MKGVEGLALGGCWAGDGAGYARILPLQGFPAPPGFPPVTTRGLCAFDELDKLDRGLRVGCNEQDCPCLLCDATAAGA